MPIGRALSIATVLVSTLVVGIGPSRLPVNASTLPAARQCASREQVAHVTAVTEGMRVRHKTRWTDAKKGTKVYAGDMVQTKTGQKAALAVCGGGKVYVNQETVAVLRTRAETQATKGEVAEHSAKKGTQVVRARDAVARSHGTLFDVKVQKKQSVITVASGEVQLRNGHGQVRVSTNHQSQVKADSKPGVPKPVDAQRVLGWANPLAETWKVLTAKGALAEPYRLALDSHATSSRPTIRPPAGAW